MKAYLEELQKQAGDDQEKTAAPSGAAKIIAKAHSAREAKRQVLGFEKNDEGATYPLPPLTLTSLLSATKLPSTKPSFEKVLLPNADVSPTIGIGLGGLQMRVRVKRRPDEVPKGSIVGMGLENQSATGGAADISLKPKHAGASAGAQLGARVGKYVMPALGGLAGGAVGAGTAPEDASTGEKVLRTLGGAAVGAGGTALVRKGLGAAGKNIKERLATWKTLKGKVLQPRPKK